MVLLVTNRTAVWVCLVSTTILVHTLVALLLAPYLDSSGISSSTQALLLYWGGLGVLASAHAGQITSIEERHERVTNAVGNASHMLMLLRGRLGLKDQGVESFYRNTWLEVLKGSAGDQGKAVARLEKRELQSDHLELALEARIDWTDGLPDTTHDVYLQVLAALQAFRQEAYINIESSNVMRLVLTSTLYTALPSLLSAMEVFSTDPDKAYSPWHWGYWVIVLLAGTLSASSSVFLIHGRFCLRFYGAHYVRQAQRVTEASKPVYVRVGPRTRN